MEYLINDLAKLSGVSTRTLRYYDEIGLLVPSKVLDNGYRLYSLTNLNMLQQILFYKELGFELKDIKKIIHEKTFDRRKALNEHLRSLENQQRRLQQLIINVKESLREEKGEIMMNDKAKFQGFKEKYIEENEENFGVEMRKRYGDKVINEANEKFLNISEKDLKNKDIIEEELINNLTIALKNNDVTCIEAKKVCELHAKWLMFTWPEGMYSKENHLALAAGYLSDERFIKYYDSKAGIGATEFLVEALKDYFK